MRTGAVIVTCLSEADVVGDCDRIGSVRRGVGGLTIDGQRCLPRRNVHLTKLFSASAVTPVEVE